MKVRIPVTIRPYQATDAPIVFDSWARSMADDLGIKDEDERRSFVRSRKPITAALLERGETLVATPRLDVNQVHGWICFERPDVLHFVFVKKDFRRGTIARQLVEATELPGTARASHSTAHAFARIARLFENLTHEPALGAP